VKAFFADAELAANCAIDTTTDAGHGRIEERTIQATDAIDWLKERHPDWQICAASRPLRQSTSTRKPAR
jgi:hypothetical protein